MANTTALSSLSSSQAQLLGTWTVAFKDESTGYVFSIDSDGDVVYAKTTDGGVSFGSAVTVFSSIAAVQLTIWADWWTAGDSGSLIHIWYIDDDSGDVLYRSLDTSSDSLGTQRTVSNEAAAQYNKISATKTRGGMLAVATSPVANAFWTSTNGGVSWSSRSSPWEAEEQLILLPANLADANDLWCFYWDWSANAITLKTFDDSANSWSESSTILTAVASDPNVNAQPQFAAAVRWSDGHAILVAHMWYDSTSDVLQVVDVASGSSWTSKANVTSGADDTASVAIAIDQNTGDLYVAYAGHEDGSQTIGSSVGIYYKKSTDGGASWGSQQAFGELNDDYRGLWVDHGSRTFLFAPVFFNDDLNRVETNANNAVAITPPPPASAMAALALWAPELSATGTHRQSGGSAFVLWAPALAASGELSHLGAASLELWVPVLYAGGGYRIPGSASLLLWPPVLAATGFNNADAAGAGGLALWAPMLGASGEQAIPGAAGLVLWVPFLSGAGAMQPAGVSGLVLWPPAISASGRQAFPGAATLTLWVPRLTGAGGQGILSAASLGLWAPGLDGTGVLQPTATAGLVLWVPALAADGAQELPGGAALDLWAPTLGASGAQALPGTASLSLWLPAIAAMARQSHLGASGLAVWLPSLAATGTQKLTGSVSLTFWRPVLAGAALHGYVHGSGAVTAPFPLFAALANFPVPSGRGRLRVDVYTAAGAKLAAGPLTAVLEASYSLALDLVGEFSLTLPAVDRRAALLAQGQRLWLYREGEGLLFKGIVERLQTEVAAEGAHLLHVSGASISRDLVWANTLLGRNYSAATLSDAVVDLLSGTGWSAGELAAPITTLEATFEGASRWAALLKVAEIFGLHLREDPWTETVDLDAFGDAAPFVLQNVGAVSPRLRENPGLVPVATVSVAEESTDLWNNVLVHGAGEGINRLTLQWSSRSSPYTIQNAAGPDGESYWYLEDAASVASYGRRQTVIVDKDAIPLSNSSSGLEAAANALYDGAVTWLGRHKAPLTTYTAKPVGLTHVDPSTGSPRFQVGDQLRLRYAGVVQDQDGSLRAWRSVDALVWLMGFSRRLHGYGSDDWELTLANVDRHAEDGASRVARALEELRALQVAKRPYTYAGSYGPYRDSVDSTRGLVLPVNFKRNAYLLREAHLYVTRKKVKSNVSTVASGGSSSPTSSSGGSSTPTSSSEASHTHTVSGQTANGAGAHRHVMFARYGSSLQTSAAASPAITAYESAAGDPHYHGMSGHTHGVDRYEFRAVNAGGTNKVAYLPNNPSSVYDEDLHTYSAAADHTHSITATTSAAGTSHAHTVSVPSHTHTVTVPDHVHGLTYGIYEGPSPGSITAVLINGTDRTSALGGPWAADISELDVSAYLMSGGEPLRQVNTVEVRGASLMDLIVEVKTLETATSIVPV